MLNKNSKMNLDDLEEKIIGLQRSTRTALPAFTRVHNWLRMKSRWYYNWHTKPNRSKLHGWIAAAYAIGAVFTFINFSLYYGVNSAAAASYTWDGGGATNNWSDCDNWSSNICPTSADTAVFNTTSTKDSVIDASFGGVVTSFQILSGYTGTVTLERSFQTTGSFVQQGNATFNASSHAVDVDSTMSISAGTFTASSTTTSIRLGLTLGESATFNHNNGTIAFDSDGSGTVSCANKTFNLVTINQTGSGTLTINSDCTLPIGNNPTIGPATVALAGTLTGSGTITKTGIFTFNSGATLTGFSALSLATFNISGASLDLSSYSALSTTNTTLSSGSLTPPNGADINGTLTISGGTFTAPSGNMTVAGGLTISNDPTFSHNSGTITFDGSTAILSCNNVTFNLVQIATTSGTKTVSSNCSLPLGASPTVLGTFTNSGSLSGSGTITFNGTTTMQTTSSISGFDGIIANSIFAINGPSLNFGSYTTADFNSTFTFTTGGTFTAPSGTMTVAGSFTIGSGTTFNANGGTVAIDGGAQTLACNNATFNLVTINVTSSMKTIGSDCTLPLGASPIIGARFNSTGVFSGSGTLTLDGSTAGFNTGASLSGFNGLVANSAVTIAGGTLDLGSYTTTDFNNTFTLSSGSFTAPATVANFASTFTISGSPTFNANNGAIHFTSTGAQNITCNNVTFNLVAITATSTSNTTINNGCNFPLGANPTLNHRVTLTGTFSGTGTLTTNQTFTMNTGSSFSGFSSYIADGTVTVGGGNLDMSNYSSFTAATTVALNSGSLTMPNAGADLNGALTISGGTFTAPSGVMTIATALTISGAPTFNANSGLISFDSATGGTLSCNNVAFHLVSFADSAANKTVSNNCSLPLGNNPTVTGGIILNGVLTGTGTVTLNSPGFNTTMNSGQALSGFTGLVVNGALSISGATLDLSNYTSVTLNSNLNLNSGSFKAPSGTMNAFGVLNANEGSFDANGGTVILSSGNQTITGTLIFHNLTKTVTQAATLTFSAGTTQTITGALTLEGAANNVLSLVSTITGSPWQMNPQGSRAIRYLNVSDSNNINTAPIAAGNGTVTNLGNNSGWNFHTPTVSSLGPTTMTNGSKITDTTPDFTFTLADSDANDTVTYQIQVATSSTFTNPTIDTTSSAAAPSPVTYTATKALADGNYYWRVRATDSVNQSSDWVVANSGNVAFSLGNTITPTPTPTPALEVTDATAETGTEENPDQRFTVVIRLLDANKQPIVGAKVTLRSEPKETVSDSEGYATFEDVELGEHTLTVEHNGQIGEQKIAITKDTVANLDPQKEGTISITVELKNVQTSPSNTRLMYSLYGTAGALSLILIALLLVLYSRKKQYLTP